MTSHVLSLAHTTHPLVGWNCRLYLVTFLISKNLTFFIHLQISVQLFAALCSRKYHVPCCLAVQDSSDITSNCMHLVAVNEELTETLDMVPILKSDDIQPPHPLLSLPWNSRQSCIGRCICLWTDMQKVVFIIMTVLELPSTCTVKSLWH